MIHIKLTKDENYYEQLFFNLTEKAIPAVVSIDLDRIHHKITIYKVNPQAPNDSIGIKWKTFDTEEIGCCNVFSTYEEFFVENFDFLDEF